MHRELAALGLAAPGATTIVDVTTCPGTDTCKLGISSSRGLGAELRNRLAAKSASLPEAVKSLKIKISGCFNSCGQHHIADIGFYGNSRKIDGRTVPHFQVILGGQWTENAGSYGLAVGSVPSKAIPEAVDALTDAYAHGRESGERFQAWIARMGKRNVKELIKPFMAVPPYAEDPSFYSDWSDVREFTIGDLGVGECAGEVVSLFGIEVVKAEAQAFDAQIALDEGDPEAAEELAYAAMLSAARALVRTEYIDVTQKPDDIVAEWKKRFFDTRALLRPLRARARSAAICSTATRAAPERVTAEIAAQRVEEAQLFIEAAHACEAREVAARAVPPIPGATPERRADRGARRRRPRADRQRPRTPMNPQRLAIKLFADAPDRARTSCIRFIGVFHRFIQQAAVPGLLIDVADYAHVPDGPGVILIGHEVDYGIDLAGGRTGLLTTRKRAGDAGLPELFRDTLGEGARGRARDRGGRHASRVRFAPDAIEIAFPDRLAAPNTASAFELRVQGARAGRARGVRRGGAVRERRRIRPAPHAHAAALGRRRRPRGEGSRAWRGASGGAEPLGHQRRGAEEAARRGRRLRAARRARAARVRDLPSRRQADSAAARSRDISTSSTATRTSSCTAAAAAAARTR